MENVMTRLIKPLWTVSALLIIVLSACGGNSAATQTANVDAIYTQAAGTVAAKLTQTASMFTNTPFVSPTTTTQAATQTPLITNTPEFTNTPLVINTQVPTAQNSCDNMIYVADVTIPDGSTVAAGSKFIKTWRIRNNGQCTWNTGYRLIYGWASDSWKEIKNSPPASVKLTTTVAPGAEYEISVSLTAPTTTGIYMAAFRLQNDKGYNFGTILFLTFQVNGTPAP
jgi:hypothetical protein